MTSLQNNTANSTDRLAEATTYDTAPGTDIYGTTVIQCSDSDIYLSLARLEEDQRRCAQVICTLEHQVNYLLGRLALIGDSSADIPFSQTGNSSDLAQEMTLDDTPQQSRTQPIAFDALMYDYDQWTPYLTGRALHDLGLSHPLLEGSLGQLTSSASSNVPSGYDIPDKRPTQPMLHRENYNFAGLFEVVNEPSLIGTQTFDGDLSLALETLME